MVIVCLDQNMAKYLQGKYTAKHPEKYEGNHSQIFFRSSWELKYFNWVDSNPSVVKWSSECIIVPYVCPTDGRAHRYFPDSKIQIRGKDGTLNTWLVEIKPAAQTVPPKPKAQKTKRFLIEAGTYLKNRAKWEAAERYAKDRNWEFIILTEHHLGLSNK
jgi:hypothetical protein